MTWPRPVAAVPWLAQLDPALADELDLAELVVPTGEVARVRSEVESAVDAYVMTYRRAAPTPGHRQLCQLLAAAPLTPAHLAVLDAAEDRLRPEGVLLCAYARPLRRH